MGSLCGLPQQVCWRLWTLYHVSRRPGRLWHGGCGVGKASRHHPQAVEGLSKRQTKGRAVGKVRWAGSLWGMRDPRCTGSRVASPRGGNNLCKILEILERERVGGVTRGWECEPLRGPATTDFDCKARKYFCYLVDQFNFSARGGSQDYCHRHNNFLHAGTGVTSCVYL
jgi:hypothetical protein